MVSFHSFVKVIGNFALKNLVSKKDRRALFLSSLFISIARYSPKDEKILKEFSDRHQLTDDQKVTPLPVGIHRYFWNDQEIALRQPLTNLTEDQTRGLAMRIINSSPRWCMYDSYDVVLKETISVIKDALEKRQQKD